MARLEEQSLLYLWSEVRIQASALLNAAFIYCCKNEHKKRSEKDKFIAKYKPKVKEKSLPKFPLSKLDDDDDSAADEVI